MARVNYQHEKRQRDLAKKRKKEEKLQRKGQKNPGEFEVDPGYLPPKEDDTPSSDADATPPGTDQPREDQP